MTDTHSHIYMPDAFEDGGVEAMLSAMRAGVNRVVFPCVTIDSLVPMRHLHEQFPMESRLAIGLHPTEVGEDWREQLDKMEALLPGDFSAIGEVGIDLYHDATMRAEQKEAFARQLKWASKYSLPVIIHCRNGLDDTLEVLSTAEKELPVLIFHSFTGDVEDVRRIRKVCDPWFGINGVVTFKNAPALRAALPEIGLDRILLETDAPWLAPVPNRGKRNESAYIPHIRNCVAEVLAKAGVVSAQGAPVDAEIVEEVTDASAVRIFGF